MSHLNVRQMGDWKIYESIWGLGAERTSIDVSHQTYHLVQLWTEGKDKRQPKELAPQFEPAKQNEAEQALDELVSIVS
jgi:hypothetical protein